MNSVKRYKTLYWYETFVLVLLYLNEERCWIYNCR